MPTRVVLRHRQFGRSTLMRAHLRSGRLFAGFVLALALAVAAAMPGAAAGAELPDEPRGIDHACANVDLSDPGFDFPDIDGVSGAAQDAVRCLVAYEITAGYEDGTFRPSRQVRRYEMALFLSRVHDYIVETTDVTAPDEIVDPGFTDTPDLSEEAQQAIGLLYTLGITTGTTESTYTPHGIVSRRDMASFLLRLQDVLAPGSYDTDVDDVFPDVDSDLPRADDVHALAGQGIVRGFTDGTYRPHAPVSRVQMAHFLMRHVDENVDADRLPALDPPPPGHVVDLTGSGQTLTDPFTLEPELTTFTMTHEGESNFAPRLLDDNGDLVALLANTIGSYQGSAAASVDAGQYRLDVAADGAWEVVVEQPSYTSGEALPTTFEGTSDTVTGPFVVDADGLVTFEYEYTGDRNFIVWVWSVDGDRGPLLVNEIGSIAGSTGEGLNAGIYVLEVSGTDGNWLISVD